MKHRMLAALAVIVGLAAVAPPILAHHSYSAYDGDKPVTFKNAKIVRETVAAVPADQFMLETDSPYLAPVPYRGKRGEPAYVKEISETVAQIRGCSLEELSRATCATAERFFPKLKPA